MIAVTAEQLKTIKDVLSRFKGEVRIFGSRLTSRARSDSDLDVCLIGANGRVPPRDVGDLREEFEKTDLPYVVDLVDYYDLTESFRSEIAATGVDIATLSSRISGTR